MCKNTYLFTQFYNELFTKVIVPLHDHYEKIIFLLVFPFSLVIVLFVLSILFK